MLGDTIAAIASAPGASARGVIRVSGPSALTAVGELAGAELARARGGERLLIPVRGEPVEALALIMPAPGSYTGEDVVELHLPGSPVLLECVLADLRTAGVRAATPGEFTRRAFEHGRIRLEQAEAIADLIAAEGESARRLALHALTGGLRATVDGARAAVQDALALIESGLDFAEGETGEVDAASWLAPIERAQATLAAAVAALPEATPGGELLLLGAANAGKSSLCNALSERDAVLVDARAGTTRDVLAVRLVATDATAQNVDQGVTLLDAPGDLDAPSDLDAAALRLRDQVGLRAAGALLVVDVSAPRVPALSAALPVRATIFTKIDLLPLTAREPTVLLAAHHLDHLPRPHFFVSSSTGEGLVELRRSLLAASTNSHAHRGSRRWRDALEHALASVQRAHSLGATGANEELVAAELGDALVALDAIDGRSSPEDLLDRVFARFCLGK